MPRCYMVKKALCNKYISSVARGFESWGRGRSTPSPTAMQIPVSPIEGSVAPPVAQGTNAISFSLLDYLANSGPPPADYPITKRGSIETAFVIVFLSLIPLRLSSGRLAFYPFLRARSPRRAFPSFR